MAALRLLLSLTVLLLQLGPQQQAWAKNDAPCQRGQWNNGYSTFVMRHIRSDLPNSLNPNEWFQYIKNHGGCSRPTQSFLKTSELNRVLDVCTNRGGAIYKENLCISRQDFSFVTVRSELDTCGIRSVTPETKRLILACEVVDNLCLPVHFEGNPRNATPSNNAKGCQDPASGGHAPNLRMPWFLLIILVLITINLF